MIGVINVGADLRVGPDGADTQFRPYITRPILAGTSRSIRRSASLSVSSRLQKQNRSFVRPFSALL